MKNSNSYTGSNPVMTANFKTKTKNMSHTETHIGKLRKVDLKGLTIEQWAKAKCREKAITDLEHYDTWKEALLDSGKFYTYFFVNDDVYEKFEHIEIEEGDDIDVLTPNNDGTYSFVMQFYNGGTYLGEMIEDALKKLKT